MAFEPGTCKFEGTDVLDLLHLGLVLKSNKPSKLREG